MTTAPRIIDLETVDSTNSYLKRCLSEGRPLPNGTVVSAHFQTGGRGQTNNRWESAPGQNATFSLLLLDPPLSAEGSPFDLSKLISVAIVRFIHSILPPTGKPISIKWPNDIYIGDNKVAGILIENEWAGNHLSHSILGVGININQRSFTSDAPNPTSLSLEGSPPYSPKEAVATMVQLFETLLAEYEVDHKTISEAYLSLLYRFDGKGHTFCTPEAEPFEAIIEGVDRMGHLLLRHASDGLVHPYAFKQVSFL